MQVRLAEYADEAGVLATSARAERARTTLEHAVANLVDTVPIVLDFAEVGGVAPGFADAFFGPLRTESLPGYYGGRPLLLANASPAVKRDLEASGHAAAIAPVGRASAPKRGVR